MPNPNNPMIVQGDKTALLEVNSERYAEARDILARFAELEKSPEYIHTYRITPLSLWHAASAGLQAADIIDGLNEFAKYLVPGNVIQDIQEYIACYGCVKLVQEGDDLHLVSDDAYLIRELMEHKAFRAYIVDVINPTRLAVHPVMRGHIKQVLVQIGYPAEDLAGYATGDVLPFQLRAETRDGRPFTLRGYQQEAAEIFYAAGSARGGSGTIVLPCGAGKTIVGMTAMHQLQTSTLILSPNTVAVRQWIHELLDKTTLTEEEIGEYSGLTKDIKPVTVSTYQILTYRKRGAAQEAGYEHFALFSARNWGLIIYDEVHLLPAPVFRITAEIQARRRLGLTATLVREDHREEDVFSLIGPKKYDVPWKELEHQGWIATAECHEIRMPLPNELRMTYAMSEDREKYRVAAENPIKYEALRLILDKHPDDQILVIGQYLDQLAQIQQILGAPLITGKTPTRDREV